MTRRNSLTALRIETCAGFVPRDARAERATSPEQKSSRSFHDLTTLTIRQVIDFHSIPLYTTCNNHYFVLLLVFLLRLLHVVVVGISATLRIPHFPQQRATVPALSPAIVVSNHLTSNFRLLLRHQHHRDTLHHLQTAFNMAVLPKYEPEIAYLVFQHITEPIAERKHTRASSSLTFLTYQTYRRTLQHLCSRSIQHWPKAGGTMLRCRRPLHFQTSPRNTLCAIRRRR